MLLNKIKKLLKNKFQKRMIVNKKIYNCKNWLMIFKIYDKKTIFWIKKFINWRNR